MMNTPPLTEAEVLRQSDGCVFWGLVCRGLAFTHTGWKGYCSIYSALARVRGRVAPARHTHTHAHTLSLLQKALDIIKKQSWQLPPPRAKTQQQQCVCHNNLLSNNTHSSSQWQARVSGTRRAAVRVKSRFYGSRRQCVCWLINSLVPSASVHSHCRGVAVFLTPRLLDKNRAQISVSQTPPPPPLSRSCTPGAAGSLCSISPMTVFENGCIIF